MKKGFTLIELLVVVSIISLLAAMILVSLSMARARARDSERKQNMIQLRTALELYQAQNNSYPVQPYWTTAPTGLSSCSWSHESEDWIPGLASAGNGGPFIPSLPKDPNPKRVPCRGYYYISDGKDYMILNNIAESDPAPQDAFYRFPAGCREDPLRRAHTFVVYTEGWRCL